MAEVGATNAQLDRIEQGLSDLRALNTQILDRLTRMEERQNGHAADLERAEARIARLESKVEKVEQDAVASRERSHYQHKTLFARWSGLKTVGLLLLGAALSMTGKVIANAIRGL
ncbi:hypothetical protein RSO41_13410 [Halomonas sp. I1]|uniref:hypothetical protein n=1 Tax=Halomonas sp. I1 TaxID=393536 RepID=UPI0028DE59B7|nr:hypothetical protein [Halomonas sp. I1]MDT8895650.1 hypothetical protein [Halomonas sp. I1]